MLTPGLLFALTLLRAGMVIPHQFDFNDSQSIQRVGLKQTLRGLDNVMELNQSVSTISRKISATLPSRLERKSFERPISSVAVDTTRRFL
ncbi:hypothetical protein B0J13DRAFT_554767 [Dactylonectria estremocensis]|uniref:Uncharacterized protein n=1 Tax=Dactylonectria estremocensis TaxID=1079267 RepID=A0A9P9J669_9HYPO|nr:hypothetical protein B0J13DRAFT_554767 [Dactylonectria estremocensis]